MNEASPQGGTSLIRVLRRKRQEDQEFKTSISSIFSFRSAWAILATVSKQQTEDESKVVKSTH